jgi:hypothetical protein
MDHPKGEYTKRLDRDLKQLNESFEADGLSTIKCRTTDASKKLFVKVFDGINAISRCREFPLKDQDDIEEQNKYFDKFPDMVKEKALLGLSDAVLAKNGRPIVIRKRRCSEEGKIPRAVPQSPHFSLL